MRRVLGVGVVAAALVAACGGGGGGGGGGASGGGSTPLVYSGNTSAAVIGTGNAAVIASGLMGGTTDTTTASATAPQSSRGQLDIGRELTRGFFPLVAKPGALPAGVPVDRTSACGGGGSVRLFGDVNGDGTGLLNVTYAACREGGTSMTGSASLRIDAYNVGAGMIVDGTLEFARIELRGADNVDITGTVRIQRNLATNVETATENAVVLYLGSGRMTRSENLVWTETHVSLVAPSSYSETVGGRIYDSMHGYVDVTTNSPFVFASQSQEFPSGGELVLTGAAGARIRLTALSTTLAMIAVDANGDGAYETSARLPWSGIAGPMGADLRDTDGDGMHDSWETANGLNPSSAADAALDTDGDGQTNLAEYLAGTDPRVAGAPPPPPPPSALPATIVSLANVTDLVHDAGTARIYATVAGPSGAVVPINPATGTVGGSISSADDPRTITISDDGQFLYVALGGAPTVRRIAVAFPHATADIPLGSGTFGARYAEDVAVLPGAPASIAVSLRYSGVSPRHAGVAILDGMIMRGTLTPGHTGANVIEFSGSAATLYGYNNETTESGFRRMQVTAGGVSVLDVHDSFNPAGALISGFGVDMKFGGGLIFATTGAVVDPVARTVLGTVSLPVTFGNSVVPDASLGRVFYLSSDGGTWKLYAFSMSAPFAVLGSGTVPGIVGTPGSLVRYGTRGLAFRTTSGQVFLIESTTLIP